MTELQITNPNKFPPNAWTLLSQRITEKRKNRMLEIVTRRTEHIRLVLQDIHDSHNIAACIRSAEAFGILNIDIVNTYQKLKRSGVSKGADRWLLINKWNSISACSEFLKKSGYKIAAGFPGQHNMKLSDIPVNRPVAVLFGNEHNGINAEWNEFIDYKFTIPMDGMVESLNISVSAALSLFDLRRRALIEVDANSYFIGAEKQNMLLSKWACQESRNYLAELQILNEKTQDSGDVSI